MVKDSVAVDALLLIRRLKAHIERDGCNCCRKAIIEGNTDK
jgi:hypothetical protein